MLLAAPAARLHVSLQLMVDCLAYSTLRADASPEQAEDVMPAVKTETEQEREDELGFSAFGMSSVTWCL